MEVIQSSIQDEAFQLKSDFLPLTVMKFSIATFEEIESHLNEVLSKAPNYFNNAPIILDLSQATREQDNLDLKAITELLRRRKIVPVGIRGLEDDEKSLAAECNLAILKPSQSHVEKVKPVQAHMTQATPPPKAKIITRPVRGGTQVYAKGTDLVILAAVNPGAECIADGNIHIYGPLRGRALAGAKGDREARIFCRQLDAELISIAGQFRVREDIQSPENAELIQIFLKDDQLHIEEL